MNEIPQLSPELTAGELASLAASEPQHWEAIKRHPNAYPDLIEWISAQSKGRESAEIAVDAARESSPSPSVQTPATPLR